MRWARSVARCDGAQEAAGPRGPGAGGEHRCRRRPPPARGRGRRGGRRLHPPRRRDGQPGVLHPARHPRRRWDDRLRRAATRQAEGLARGQRGHRCPGRTQLLDRGGADDAVRRPGRPLLRVGRDRRAAPPRQGRRPSGTARRTAQLVAAARARPVSDLCPTPPAPSSTAPGAPMSTASGSTACGSAGWSPTRRSSSAASGETLTIRHDSLDRVSFTPGVLLGAARGRRAPRA